MHARGAWLGLTALHASYYTAPRSYQRSYPWTVVPVLLAEGRLPPPPGRAEPLQSFAAGPPRPATLPVARCQPSPAGGYLPFLSFDVLSWAARIVAAHVAVFVQE